MDQQLLDRLLRFVASVYDQEPLDDYGRETPMGDEALALMELLSEHGAADPTMPKRAEQMEVGERIEIDNDTGAYIVKFDGSMWGMAYKHDGVLWLIGRERADHELDMMGV